MATFKKQNYFKRNCVSEPTKTLLAIEVCTKHSTTCTAEAHKEKHFSNNRETKGRNVVFGVVT